MFKKYTIVAEQKVSGECNHRLRFGVANHIVSRPNGITLHSFEPHKTFGIVRWKRNDFGTIHWNLYICETVDSGRITKIPGVYPGAELLFRARGTKATRRLLARLTKLEKTVGGDLAIVPASYWRKYNSAEIQKISTPQISPFLEQSHA